MSPPSRQHIEDVLEDYFDLRIREMVAEVLRSLDEEELADDDAVDEVRDTFLEVALERYGREAPGWREATEHLVTGEFERQVEEARRLQRVIEEELG